MEDSRYRILVGRPLGGSKHRREVNTVIPRLTSDPNEFFG
jgi:hypothetical protein